MELYPRSQSRDWFHALKTKTISDEHQCSSYILESSHCKLSHTCWPWKIETQTFRKQIDIRYLMKHWEKGHDLLKQVGITIWS